LGIGVTFAFRERFFVLLDAFADFFVGFVRHILIVAESLKTVFRNTVFVAESDLLDDNFCPLTIYIERFLESGYIGMGEKTSA
jgi:hypothetical protein